MAMIGMGESDSLGMHEAQGWAITETGQWESIPVPQSPYGSVHVASTGATLDFVFRGTALYVAPGCGDGAPCDGNLQVIVDGGEPVTLDGTAETTAVVRGLSHGEHSAQIRVASGQAGIRAITVRREAPLWLRTIAFAVVALALLGLATYEIVRQIRVRRPPSEEPLPPPPPPPEEPPAYPRRRLWRGLKQ